MRWLLDYINNNLKPNNGKQKTQNKHSRHIPGHIRQIILEEFEKYGRFCNGVSGKTKRHKVESGTQIEFDHVLPHSKGGTTNLNNIQILCKECNRIKSATAK